MLYSEYEDKDGVNGNEVILWIISHQLSRRNLTAFQRSELALRLKPVVSDKAKDNQSKGGGSGNGSVRLKSENPIKTDKVLADIAGVGKDTIRNTETILNKGTKEDIQSFTKLLVSGGKSE